MKYPKENDRGGNAVRVRRGRMQTSKTAAQQDFKWVWLQKGAIPEGVETLPTQIRKQAMN